MNTDKKEKTFKVMNENGTCYSFRMHAGTTLESARKYARTWNALSGETAKISKIWEISEA